MTTTPPSSAVPSAPSTYESSEDVVTTAQVMDTDTCPRCGGVVGADTCEDCLWPLWPHALPPSAYWADSWYPWLERGWCECTCGLFFHSGREAPACVKHEQHLRETLNHPPARAAGSAS